MQVGDIGQDIDQHHARHADDQCPWQVPLRGNHLFGDEVGLLPATIGKQHGHQRRADRQDERGRGCGLGQRRGGRGQQPQDRARPCGNDDGERQQLQHGEDVLRHRSPAHPQVVDDGKQDDGAARHRDPPTRRRVQQREQVVREGDGHGGDRTGADDEQQGPRVEKGWQSAKGITDVHVVSAGPWYPGTQFGEYQRPDDRNDATQDPDPERERCGEDPLGHHLRVPEDACPDDAAHHQHHAGKKSDTPGVGDRSVSHARHRPLACAPRRVPGEIAG